MEGRSKEATNSGTFQYGSMWPANDRRRLALQVRREHLIRQAHSPHGGYDVCAMA